MTALIETVFPTDPAPPLAIKLWLSSLYATVDSHDESAPSEFASLFTADAVVYGMAGKASGTKEILASRSGASTHFKSRTHRIQRVYTQNAAYSDILLIGDLTAELKNGKVITADFVARVVFDLAQGGVPKGTEYRVWGDSAPWSAALKG